VELLARITVDLPCFSKTRLADIDDVEEFLGRTHLLACTLEKWPVMFEEALLHVVQLLIVVFVLLPTVGLRSGENFLGRLRLELLRPARDDFDVSQLAERLEDPIDTRLGNPGRLREVRGGRSPKLEQFI
jgi:hypothetical protein